MEDDEENVKIKKSKRKRQNMMQNRGFRGEVGKAGNIPRQSKWLVSVRTAAVRSAVCNVTEDTKKHSPYNKTVFCLLRSVSRLMV
jgi:hypothetical protein